MHARVSIYTLTSGTPEEVADKAKEGMLSTFRDQPGFVSYELVSAAGRIVSISRWESSAQADAATKLAASWVKDNIADRVKLEENLLGDVILSS